MDNAGKKGKYLPITITVNDEPDQFGNQGPVVVEQSKEERDQKTAKTYLGNVKVVWTNGKFPEKIINIKYENLVDNFEDHIDPNDPTNNCLDVAIITSHDKRTEQTIAKLKTIAGRALSK